MSSVKKGPSLCLLTSADMPKCLINPPMMQCDSAPGHKCAGLPSMEWMNAQDPWKQDVLLDKANSPGSRKPIPRFLFANATLIRGARPGWLCEWSDESLPRQLSRSLSTEYSVQAHLGEESSEIEVLGRVASSYKWQLERISNREFVFFFFLFF